MSGRPERDPGLAPERTELAWSRTGLSAAAVGALALHAFADRGAAGALLVLLLFVVAGVAYATGGSDPAPPGRLRAVSAGVAAAAVVAMILASRPR